MKRYIFTLLWLCCIMVQAQDIYVVHYKNGSTRQFPHGIYAGSLSFWGDADEEKGLDALRNQAGLPTFATELAQVTDYATDDASPTHYSIFLGLKSDAPTSLQLQLCLGHQAGVCLEQCDTVLAFQHESAYSNNKWDNVIAFGDWEQAPSTALSWHGQATNLPLGYLPYSRLALVHGQTYYYRTLAHIPVLRGNGLRDTTVVYGPEQSFRIPDLAEESGAVPREVVREVLSLPTVEAWEQFLGMHFAGSAKQATDRGLCELWLEWQQTDEGHAATSTVVTSIHEYDNARVTFYHSIPDEFAAWLRSHEIIITAPEEYVPATGTWNGTSYLLSAVDCVSDEGAAWDNPTGHFMRIRALETDYPKYEPSNVFISLRHTIPSVAYRMTITFAPEPDTETYLDKPCIITVTHGPYTPDFANLAVTQANKKQLYASSEKGIPATEPTRLTIDIPADELVNHVLNIHGSSNLQIHVLGATDVFRIAEIRLSPVQGDGE